MTHHCIDVFYHSRHTALILFLFIFSYFFSLYQCYLVCRPLSDLRHKKPSFLSISEYEPLHLAFLTLSFTMTICIDYYLIRPSFAVCLMIALYYTYERFSNGFNLFLMIGIDLIGLGFIYYLQAGCYVKTLVFLRVLLEALKLGMTYWANDFLRIHKAGGIHLIGLCILACWIFFFLLKR